MTFTWDISGGFTDLARVRFHLGDMDSAAPKFTDEEINAVIAEAGSWELAVIACIDSLIMRLNVPDFKADWLQVDSSTARAGYEQMRPIKKRELGLVGRLSSSSKNTYRVDSGQTSEPDYTNGRP